MFSRFGGVLAGMVVAACLSQQATAQTYLPGPPPTVGEIQHQTVSPLNPSRTEIGIGESVHCWIDPSTWLDPDIRIDGESQTTVYDSMGEVVWAATGAGALVEPAVGNNATLTADLTDANDTVTIQATISDSGTMGLDTPLVKTLAFAVLVPNGVKVWRVTDKANFATPPPPNNVLGAYSLFADQTTPDTVDFGPNGASVTFRENKPGDAWTWPDGTNDSTNADNTKQYTVSTVIDKATGNPVFNISVDKVARAGDPVARLAGKNFSITIQVPREYQDPAGKWVSFFATETHVYDFRGATLDERATVNASNAASGGWLGPWKSVP